MFNFRVFYYYCYRYLISIVGMYWKAYKAFRKTRFLTGPTFLVQVESVSSLISHDVCTLCSSFFSGWMKYSLLLNSSSRMWRKHIIVRIFTPFSFFGTCFSIYKTPPQCKSRREESEVLYEGLGCSRTWPSCSCSVFSFCGQEEEDGWWGGFKGARTRLFPGTWLVMKSS